MGWQSVVITGLGCLNPNGTGKSGVFSGIDRREEGKSGTGPISAFPTNELDCKIAGEIRDFEAVC